MTTEHTALCPARGWSACDCDWEDRIRADDRADLRARVKAMSSWAIGENRDGHTALWINKDDVLALIDTQISGGTTPGPTP
jgi:hypothetical protein